MIVGGRVCCRDIEFGEDFKEVGRDCHENVLGGLNVDKVDVRLEKRAWGERQGLEDGKGTAIARLLTRCAIGS